MSRSHIAPNPKRRPPVITEWHWKAIRKQIAGDTGGAMLMWAKLLARNPRDAKALYFQSLAYYSIHELPRAIAYMRACLREAPTHADAWYNLGKYLHDSGQLLDALDHYLAAIENEPGKVEALTNAGGIYHQLGDDESALACQHMALAQETDRPEALYNRSFTRLLHGDYPTGFAEYESRWQCPAFTADYKRAFMHKFPRSPAANVPLRDADGNALANPGRLLVHAEQGAGDGLMMLRYISSFDAAKIVLEVHRPIVTLAQTLFPDVKVIARGDEVPSDVISQVPMMSLPHDFETTLDIIPPPMDEPRREHIPRARACECGKLHAGLAWAGSKAHPNDADRSAPVNAFAPLLAIPGIHWTSLQVGERTDEYDSAGITRPTLEDYLATASIIRALDFVVTVDTSVAHLAGLLGTPVDILTPSAAEWRWLLNRDDSPWYPSARLWRRAGKRKWPEVLEALEREIRTRARVRDVLS